MKKVSEMTTPYALLQFKNAEEAKSGLSASVDENNKVTGVKVMMDFQEKSMTQVIEMDYEKLDVNEAIKQELIAPEDVDMGMEEIAKKLTTEGFVEEK